MTGGLFAAFQAASGDNHPVHYDREYCRARGLPDMLARLTDRGLSLLSIGRLTTAATAGS